MSSIGLSSGTITERKLAKYPSWVKTTAERKRKVSSYSTTAYLSKAAFSRCIALFTLIEGILVAVGTFFSRDWPFSWWLLIGTFIVSILGIVMFHVSDKPAVSGLGVSVMSVSLGLMIGPMVALYQANIVIGAVAISCGIMVIMSVLGIIFPAFFEGWGAALMVGLTVLVVGLFAEAIFLSLGVDISHFQLADHLFTWGGLLLFSGFVAYDWAKALRKHEYTLDKAIDASGGLILDLVNIFIRVLAIMGGSRPNN